MDIRIVNISKGPHELNREALKDMEITKLSFNVSSRLRYSSESDYIGFQIDLMVLEGNVQVFKSGFLIGLAVSGWEKDLKEGLDLNIDRSKLPEICKIAWFVATGIVEVQSSTDHFGGLVLPSLNYEDFSKDVLLVPTNTTL